MTGNRLAYRPSEAAQVLGLSLRTVHRRIADGSLRSLRRGGARLVPASELARFLGEPGHPETGSPCEESAEAAWAQRFTAELLG